MRFSGLAGAAPREPAPGLRRRRLRTSRYLATLGRVRGGWLSLRELIGDTRRVRIRHRGHRLTLRLNSSDILVLFSVFERAEYGIDLPSPPATIVDAGAYTGFSAVYFAQRYPGATILALEPEPANFALLVENTRPYPNIVPLQEALWHRTGRMELRHSATGAWGFYLGTSDSRPGAHRAWTHAVTLPALLDRFQLAAVDLLKLDVEGAELEILEDSGDWIARVGAVVAELHDRYRTGCSAAFERAAAGFERRGLRGMTAYAVRDDRNSIASGTVAAFEASEERVPG